MRKISSIHTISTTITFATAMLSILIMATNATAAGRTAQATQMTEEYKPDQTLFTGTVVTNNLKNKTITICGHNPLIYEKKEEPVSRSAAAKRPSVADAPRVFYVEPSCRLALTNMSARLSDVQTGDLVDVRYRKEVQITGSHLVASVIMSAAQHPYDSPPAAKK